MSKFKTLVFVMVLLVLTVSILSGCTKTTTTGTKKEEETKTSEKTTESKEAKSTEEVKKEEKKGPLTISINLMLGPKVPDSWIEHKLEEKLSEELNREVDLDPIMLPGWGEAKTKINLLMSDKSTMPDIGWMWGMESEFKTWVDGGVVVDMTPYFEHGQNILNYYGIDTMFAGYSQGGKMYRLPGDVGEPGNRGFVIRKDWLDALGLPVPTTAEELIEAARQFTFNDPDGNGEDDTYGFGGTNLEQSGYDLLKSLMDAYGLQTTLGGWMIQDDGTLKHSDVMPAMRDFLELFAQSQAEGIIDPSSYTRPNSERDEYKASGKAGILHEFVANFNPGKPMYIANNDLGANYIPIDPVMGPNGFSSDSPANPYGWCYCFITNKQEDETEDIFKALNYLASVEANKYIFFGEEGTHYELKDGIFSWKISKEEVDAIGAVQFKGFVSRKDEANIINTPEVQEMFKRKAETSRPLYDKSYIVAPAFDTPMYREYGSDIGDLKNKVFYEIILGEVGIEAYDEFVEQYYKMGGQEIENEINSLYQEQKELYEEFIQFYDEVLVPFK